MFFVNEQMTSGDRLCFRPARNKQRVVWVINSWTALSTLKACHYPDVDVLRLDTFTAHGNACFLITFTVVAVPLPRVSYILLMFLFSSPSYLPSLTPLLTFAPTVLPLP